MKIRIWRTIFITFNYAATIDLQILFSLPMRHLSKEQVACARLIIAYFFLYGEIEMKVPPMILTNPLLTHKSFQFMCMILKQKKINKASYQYERNLRVCMISVVCVMREREREREREQTPKSFWSSLYW